MDGLSKDVLPLWVADSDFQSPEPVVAAVQKIVDTKVLAIPMATLVFSNVPLFPGASASTTSPSVNPEIHYCPSMSFGLAIAIRAFTQPGGKVLMQTPSTRPSQRLTKPTDACAR